MSERNSTASTFCPEGVGIKQTKAGRGSALHNSAMTDLTKWEIVCIDSKDERNPFSSPNY